MSSDSLYTVAYPSVPESQMKWIQEFRMKHDPHYTVVDPHFTLVFGVRDVEESAYLTHVDAVGKRSQTVSFRCKYAMLGADDIDATAYVFLVPDEGNSAISLLHDELYRGLLQPYHRLEYPYIPHIGIAAVKDFRQAKALCDELNTAGVHVEGRLTSLSTGVLRNGKLHTLRTFPLAA
jgi:2'-5' RNA ligase